VRFSLNRIENFSTDKPDEDDYQIEKAKIAIASGRFMDLVLGKVFRRTFAAILSDFIYYS
jgi:cell division protein FtsW